MLSESAIPAKPLYSIPLMSEIESLPRNGLRVVSTFSGSGGSCLGYRMAGYEVIWANEFIPAAQSTYQLNHPSTVLDRRDIRVIRGRDILDATGLRPGELDLFDGSPPCASFSTSGKREQGWGHVKRYSDTEQRTDDLFFQYTRLLNELQPRCFIAENVSGLVKGTAKGYFKEILRALEACGYRVAAQLLDAQWLGVPQTRQRLIFVGVRQDLGLAPAHPRPLPYRYTLRDAFYGRESVPGEAWWMKSGDKMRALWQWTRDHNRVDFSDAHKALFGTNSSFNHRRCRLEQPAFTVVQGSHCIYHPTEPRTLSLPEVMRVSSFPDDFKLTGSFKQKWERVGRAVPPVMMSHIARAVETEVLRRCA
jgi:DNA (cytosine-5)-methyltransferase 1